MMPLGVGFLDGEGRGKEEVHGENMG